MSQEAERVVEVDVNLIDEPSILLHPETDLQSLEELANSIRSQGLIEPIVVRPKGPRYQLVAGYRRYLACKKFGIPTILSRIVQMNEAQAMEASATENIQRTDLDPVAEGQMYYKLITEHNRTVKSIADSLGKSPAYIEARLALLDMPEPVKTLATAHQIQLGVIPLLKRVPDEQNRIMIAGDISRRGYTVREADALITSFLEYQKTMANKPPEEILQKASETPTIECHWCLTPKPLKTFRQLTICDDCFRTLMYLAEREKRQPQT